MNGHDERHAFLDTALLSEIGSTSDDGLSLPEPEAFLQAATARMDATPAGTIDPGTAIVRIDLAGSSIANARYGFNTARLLRRAGEAILRENCPHDAVVAHLGGESFAVAIHDCPNTDAMEQLARSLMTRLAQPVLIDGCPHPFDATIGWALSPDDADNAHDLLRGANAALFAARQREGMHRSRRASPDVVTSYLNASVFERDLLAALQGDGSLELNWMPFFDAATERVVGFEALSRWSPVNHAAIAPDIFVERAELAGLIRELDSWVMRNACRQALSWREPVIVSVNISPVWLEQESLSTLIAQTLEETGLPAARLQIELSECRSFGPEHIAHRELSRVRAQGVRIALDNFGGGYFSLERLGIYPIDQIKLEQAFIRRIGTDIRAEKIVRSILQLAKSLDITCCAKGVETEQQLAFLDAHGCEEVQGFLLGRPAPLIR